MALSKGLNPRAPEYTPILSRETTSPTDAPPPSVLVSVVSTPTLHCYYPQPAPHLYFHTLPPPSYSPHLYATPYSVHPQPVAVAQLPSPATERSAPPTVIEHAADYHYGQVVSEEVRHRAPRRGFGRGGKREEFGGHERAGKLKWRPKLCKGDDQFRRGFGIGAVPKKPQQEVLPLKRDEGKTTIMIKNVPNKYTRELLLKFLEQHCRSENQRANAEKSEEAEDYIVSAFDFMYLPIDFGTGCNKGYAFVNFTDPSAVWKFYRAFHDKTWDFFQSPKIREIVSAKIQGKEALVKHFSGSTFLCESDEFLPVCFSPPKDGSGEPVKPTTVGKRIAITGPFRETRKPTKSRPCA